jgi:hypothetical protein
MKPLSQYLAPDQQLQLHGQLQSTNSQQLVMIPSNKRVSLLVKLQVASRAASLQVASCELQVDLRVWVQVACYMLLT